jgi:hypothetical protein
MDTGPILSRDFGTGSAELGIPVVDYGLRLGGESSPVAGEHKFSPSGSYPSLQESRAVYFRFFFPTIAAFAINP